MGLKESYNKNTVVFVYKSFDFDQTVVLHSWLAEENIGHYLMLS